MRTRARRRIGYDFSEIYFKPRGIPLRELTEVNISKEEMETLRLRYIEKLDQLIAATRMGISQSQYQRDVTSAMEKIIKALMNGSALSISKE